MENNMIKVVVISHGNFAEEVCRSCEMIMGKISFLENICLDEKKGIEDFQIQLECLLDRGNPEDKYLFACDLLYGSPFNRTLLVLSSRRQPVKYKLVAGANLPMVIELCNACNEGEDDLDALADHGIELAKLGIRKFIPKVQESDDL
jgi:mannose/fructose-specific phosphotransferase system component IIA